MFTWIYNFFAAMRFKKESSLPFAIYRAAQETAYSAMQEILEANAKAKQAILNSVRELDILCSRALELQYFKDFLGLKHYINQPIFTVERAADISQKRFLYLLLLVGFILSETFLYYIISGFVIPGLESVYAQIAISLFFAFLCMFGIHWGLESHNKYIYAKERHAEKRIKNDVLKKINHDRILGYIVTFLCLIFIGAAGMTRIYLVEGAVSVTSFENETQAANYANGSAWVSVLTMIFTLVLGILLAKIKLELFELNPLYKTYKEWLKNKKNIEGVIKNIEKNDKRITSNMEIARNKGWQLVLDLQKIMGREYDTQDKTNYGEYVNIKRSPGFVLNDDIFNKYHRLLSAFRELFDYTIQQHPDMRSWSEEISKTIEYGKEVIEKYNEKLPEDTELSISQQAELDQQSDDSSEENENNAVKELIKDAKGKKQNGSINHQKPVKS